jgi:glutamate formiminotransferase
VTASFSSDSPASPADERLLAVPNVSEGADPGIVAELRNSLGRRIALLDEHSDAVHNRTVFTVAGDEAALLPALLRLAATAIERIDLTGRPGAHPRIGALDVCPIVFHRLTLRRRAVDLALAVAKQLGTLDVPIFLYGELASGEERRERAFFRRGGLVGLTRRMREGNPAPDFGPGRPHPTAGGILVTARPPLAAFNLELEAGTAAATGREIAAGLRESGGGLSGVRALAIELAPGRIQISTNVHDPLAVPLARVVAAVQELAEPRGSRAVGAELVGLVPAAALAGYPGEVPIAGPDPATRTIESRLTAATD